MRRSVRSALLLLALAGCRVAGADAASKGRWIPATMEHGVAPGIRVGTQALDCGAAGARALGAPGVQLVTFSTPLDCSSCAPHLSSLDSLHARHALPANELVVVWAPGGDLDRDVAQVRKSTPRLVCVDRRGELWERYDLRHTPFTVLLVDGRIEYLNDRLLENERERTAFIDDIQRAAGGR